jgi:hypothetical protein
MRCLSPVAPPLAVSQLPSSGAMVSLSMSGYAVQLTWFQELSMVPAPLARLPTRGGHATNVHSPSAAIGSPAKPAAPLWSKPFG